ncbi:choline dehydrogenase [Sphingobium amiense]|uniref:Choline dehydrogenase n=2 Tax=Sphingobium amiense TaxID=135719 RepID=A0A494W5X2_9SPHN|nr:choline dehydrogenase [Sphingobium amiense]BBD99641.1 choline dehydrogenase [Sphingobium amiense]
MFDYIVVGAGSAGCVMANRLTEDGSSVLLLEAGKWDRDPLIHIPVGIGKIFPERLHDWGYFMEPDPGLDGRGIECARGKVVGGSSSINVMVYVRGHAGDYDRWAANGATGWSYADVLPYFKKSERWEHGGDAYRGGSGPLHTQETRYRDPILDSFIRAGAEAGYPTTADYNGAHQEGFGPVQSTIHSGRRWSSADAYLRPALKRRSLRVETQAVAHQLIIEQGRATGVRYSRRGTEHIARARREVILCGGVIDSPKLLMLSGIGDPEQLRALGIPVQVAAPGVGTNFQDHLSVITVHGRTDPAPFEQAMRYDRLAISMLNSLLSRESFAGDVPIGATAFLKSESGETLPDIQFLFLAAPFPAKPWLKPFIRPVPNTFGCRVALLRPESRGTVRLASADPAAAPLIEPCFLQAEGDRERLRKGVRMARSVMSQDAMRPHTGSEILPGDARQTDDEIDAFIRSNAVTVHHPAGTCKMGGAGDASRVVDPQLRVCGVEGLRVVDASIMPDLVGGNINAVVMMIAEKAADMVLGKTTAQTSAASAEAEVAL